MGLLNREYSEKRSFIRMKVNTPIQVSLDGGTRVIEGICQDLSGGGLLLTIDEELAIDTELKVSVNSPVGHAPMLEARCTVARVKPGPKDIYLVGLEIQEVLDQPQLEV